jgi:hypothetical protein
MSACGVVRVMLLVLMRLLTLILAKQGSRRIPDVWVDDE